MTLVFCPNDCGYFVVVLRLGHRPTVQRKCHPMREVTLKQREQARIQVLNTVLEQHLSIRLAAEIMGISERHTKRLLPSQQRRSYAGASVVVLEGLDGRLSLQHEGRIIASQEAPPSPSYLRSRNGTSPSAAIPIPDTEPASKPSVADLDLLGTKPDHGTSPSAARRRCPRRGNRRYGGSRVAGRRIATEADVSPAAEMEGGAAGQASGDVHPTDGEGIGNSQRHGEEIHRRRQSAAASAPGNSYRTSF